MILQNAYLLSFLPCDEDGLCQQSRDEILKITRHFIIAEVNLAPFHIRWPVRVLSVFFALWQIVFAGRFGQAKAEAMWEMGGSPARALTRLIRSLAMLAYAEHPIIQEKMGIATTRERQKSFREKRGASPKVEAA